MRVLAAVLAVLWALASMLMSYLMVTSTFVAKTAIKEGIPAQASLLLGGVAIEVLSIGLVWQAVRMLRRT